jgi:hypothetical protein
VKKRGCLEPLLIAIKWLKREKGKGYLEPPSTTTYFVGMWERKGLSRATFAIIKWWRWEKENGCLESPSTTTYFVGMWERKWAAASSRFCYHKMVRI